MNKLLLILISLMFSGTVSAAYGPAGCGLGSMVLKDKSGLVFNLLAATINGTSANQTFGMTSGTLGCEGTSTATVAAVSFIENNVLALSNDISKGEGVTLDAYLTLIKAEKTDKSVLKSNFSKIFTVDKSAQEIHNSILNII